MLFLPDGEPRLDLLYDIARSLVRLRSMRARDGDGDTDLTDGQVPRPVHDGVPVGTQTLSGLIGDRALRAAWFRPTPRKSSTAPSSPPPTWDRTVSVEMGSS